MAKYTAENNYGVNVEKHIPGVVSYFARKYAGLLF